MKQKNQQKKKKKRSRAGKTSCKESGDNKKEKEEKRNGNQKEEKAKVKTEKDGVESLMEAFNSVSLEGVTAAYEEGGGDLNRAAEILSDLVDNGEDPSTSSVSSEFSGLDTGSSSGYGAGSSSGTSSCEGPMEMGCLQNLVKEKGFRGSKHRHVVATGTVSTVLGKDYVKSSPRKEVFPARFKEIGKKRNGIVDNEEAEQFLCSMLGDDCELGMAVVRDVLRQCGYDVDKALSVLLDMSRFSCEESLNGRSYRNGLYYKKDRGFSIEHNDNLADHASDCISHSSESELQDYFWDTSYNHRSYSTVLTGSNDPSSTNARSNELDLPQKVLESLFKVPQIPKHEPSKMNWRNVVKKMQSLGPGFDVRPSSVAELQQDTCVEGDEYQIFRKGANQHWDAMKSCYQRAAEAYSKGERAHAAYLSDQGREKTKLAQQADERASQDIFKARNKDIENVLTIDLHGQHVKQAMRLLKLHLIFGSYVPSVQTLRVITGCGSHGVGKSKVKQSVTNLLEEEGVDFREENRGTLLIKLDAYREFGFLDTESDAE